MARTCRQAHVQLVQVVLALLGGGALQGNAGKGRGREIGGTGITLLGTMLRRADGRRGPVACCLPCVVHSLRRAEQ